MAMDKIEDESASTATTADDHVVPVFSEGLLEGQDETEDDTIFIDEVEELQPSKASVPTEKPPRAGIVMLFCLLWRDRMRQKMTPSSLMKWRNSSPARHLCLQRSLPGRV